MSIRMILLLNATMMFIFSGVFLIIAGVIKKIYEDKTKTFQGGVKGVFYGRNKKRKIRIYKN